MEAADPTYPFFPIASMLAAIMLLFVLFTSFVRQNWNLGVTFLCFWLFLENLTGAVNAILWSDNADIKHYVYCDIVSHLNTITFVVKPMATLVITRRLYLISSLRSVDLPNKATRRWNSIVEWTLGLFVPLVVAGPIYYVHQGSRFQVVEAFGCTNTLQISILELLTLHAWTLIPPLLSICFYYPKVIRVFYRQSRDVHSFLNSNTSVSRTNYLRILALASVDILLTLPIGTVNVVLSITSGIAQGSFPFYVGWSLLHNGWEPVGYPYAEVKALGTATLTQLYFTHWSSPVLAFVIFGLFGITSEARASYWRIICTAGAWLGWKPSPHTRKGQESLGDIEFGARPQDMSLGDVEMGSRCPSFVTPEAPAVKEDAEHTPDESLPPKSLSLSNEEAHPSLSQDIEGKHRLLIAGTSSSSASDAVDI